MSSSSLSASDKTLEKVIRTAAASLAAPSAAPLDAVLITSWRAGRHGTRACLLKIWGSDSSVDITGPLRAHAYHGADARWYRIATLEDGGDVNVGDGTNAPGLIVKLTDIPAWATAIDISAASVSGGTVSAAVEPLDVIGAAE